MIRSDQLSMEVLPRGATVHVLRAASGGPNLLLGLRDPAAHLALPGCLGAVVGPVANRVSGGRVVLAGTRYQMPLNEGGRTALHSGPEGLDQRDWGVMALSPDAVELAITLQDGDCGLPGNRRIGVHYRLDGSCLEVSLRAETDQPTPMNLAWHPYWTLGHAGDVRGLTLQIAAAHYLPVDALNLPTGVQQDVAQTPFDFRTARQVPRLAALDVNYCLSRENRTTPAPAATLRSAEGARLEVTTTAPGLQVYAGAHLPKRKGQRDNGPSIGPFGGLALEPQFWPDAPNQPGFPQITLHPGDIWQQLSRYRLTLPR